MNVTDIYEKLLELPVPRIILSGEVDLSMYSRVSSSLAYLTAKGSPDIEIVFNSIGGNTTHGLNIYDALRLYLGKKKGIVLSKASSIAAIILLACDERECAANAYILIHNGDCDISMNTLLFDDDALEKFRSNRRGVVSTLHKIIANRTGKSEAEIYDACKLNQSMTPEEALDFGLIDKII